MPGGGLAKVPLAPFPTVQKKQKVDVSAILAGEPKGGWGRRVTPAS